MKNIIFKILFLITFSGSISFAQQSSDNLLPTKTFTAKAYLNKQIQMIKAKEKEKTKPTYIKVKHEIVNNNTIITKSSNKNLYVFIFALTEALLLSGMIIILIKKEKLGKEQNNLRLRKNIKYLREEKIGSRPDNNLTKLRKKLPAAITTIKATGKDITYTAKKLNISKGEVHLAAKLKILTGTAK